MKVFQSVYPGGKVEVTGTEGFGSSCTEHFGRVQDKLGRKVEGLDRTTDDFRCQSEEHKEQEKTS